jgi:protein O-GlcNAc transferase
MLTNTDLQTLFARALAAHQQGRLDEAEKLYLQILEANPRHDESLHLLGLIEFGRKNYARGVELISTALEIDPNFKAAQYNLGRCFEDMKEFEKARAAYTRATELDPKNAEAWLGLSNVSTMLERKDEALELVNKALELNPKLAAAHANKGMMLASAGRYHEAMHHYNIASRLDPNNAELLFSRANAWSNLNVNEEALKNHNRAIALKPEFARGYLARGLVSRELKQFERAVADFDKAFELDPKLTEVISHRLYANADICNWTSYDKDVAALLAQAEDKTFPVNPFGLLTFSNSRRLQYQTSVNYAAQYGTASSVDWVANPLHNKKLRIGYFSGDYREHPVAQLVVGVFEHHDRANFEIELFSFGANTGDGSQRRILDACDGYFHLGEMAFKKALEFVRDRNLDAAVDLTGYTAFGRPELFSHRIAPVQVSYLGYSATTGANYMDYIIGDPNLIPPDHEVEYAERIARLPEFFMPNDRSRNSPEKIISRKSMGLPEEQIVFCCFNNTNKLNPHVFGLWMNILKRVPGSVLWLIGSHKSIGQNLRKEAEKQGVDVSRLIFAQRVAREDYFARYRCADMFLDTLPYNAHTTACDALWSGLPVLTQMGETFAARVAGSAVATIGIPEMITHSDQDYVDRAVALANAPEQLAEITRRLGTNISTSPLFDIERYTKHLEAAFVHMVERVKGGLAPESFTVPKLPLTPV